MKTIILYNDGMPVCVPESHTNDYLMRGYKSTPPEQQDENIKLRDVEIERITSENTPRHFVGIPVNFATLKELSGGLNIPTAVAKKVIENRPYQHVEDLIQKVPGTEWVGLNHQISYATV